MVYLILEWVPFVLSAESYTDDAIIWWNVEWNENKNIIKTNKAQMSSILSDYSQTIHGNTTTGYQTQQNLFVSSRTTRICPEKEGINPLKTSFC